MFDPNQPRDSHGQWAAYSVASNIVDSKHPLSSNQVQSIKDYMVGGAYQDLNEKLRTGKEISGSLKRIQDHLDEAIASHTLKRDSLLHRGFDTDMEQTLAEIDKHGGVLKDKGFTSTSTQNDVGMIADSLHIGKIHAPAGKNALAIYGEGYTEVILPRNKTLQYLRKTLNDSGAFDYHFRYK